MVDWYNLTAIDAENILTLTQTTSDIFMNGTTGVIALIVLFSVSYINFTNYNNNPKLNLMFSSFIISVVSVPLLVLSLVNVQTTFVCWGMFALFLAIAALSKQ